MLRSIPLCWTNLKLKDPYIIITDQRVPFRIVDLLELVEIVENLTKLIQKL